MASFFFRFKKSLCYNGIIGISLFVTYILFVLAMGNLWEISYLLIAGFVVLSFGALLSFHELFLYYLLQPFTEDLQVKNPIYRTVSGALYWVFWLGMDVELDSILLPLLAGGLAVTYVAIGTLVILKKAPQTFKKKN